MSRLTVQENVHGLGLFTKVLDDNAGASNNLAGVTLTVDLAETSPLTELLGIGDLDQVDVVFSAEGLDKLDVLLLSAGLDQDSKVSLASRTRNQVSVVNGSKRGHVSSSATAYLSRALAASRRPRA